MKLNNLFKICLFAAILLVGGVFIAQSAGFVSYEPDSDEPTKTKMILWDNVRIIKKGLKMSELGVNDLENVEGGIIKIENKDLYVRSYMGLNCSDYPQVVCPVRIGDLGGSKFLQIDKLLTSENLLLKSEVNNIVLIAAPGGLINFTGKVIISNNNNLVVTDLAVGDEDINSVFTTTLNTNEIKDVSGSLTLPDLVFEEVSDDNKGIMFEPRRIISLDLSAP